MNIFELFCENSLQFLWASIGILSLFILTWVLSVLITNVSIVDIVWGLGFVFQVVLYFILNLNTYHWTKGVYLLFAVIHNLRLSIYLIIRNYGKGEDKRYKELFRDKFKSNYWWISLFQVFMFQGIINFSLGIIFYSFMIFDFLNKENKFFIEIFILGCLVTVLGTCYETIADYQLIIFKSNLENKGKILKVGLFYLSRHPNYFGEFVFWFGCF